MTDLSLLSQMIVNLLMLLAVMLFEAHAAAAMDGGPAARSPSPSPSVVVRITTDKQDRQQQLAIIQGLIAKRFTKVIAEGLQRENQTTLATTSISAPALKAAAAAISDTITPTADESEPQLSSADFQQVFSSEESSAGSTSPAFSFLSGLPSIQDIMSDNLTAYPSIKVVEDLGEVAWLLRNFVICGDTLLSFRITPQLEVTILDAIEQSLGEVIGVPEEQVFLSAIANMTAPLQLQGVPWASSLDASSTSDNHPGLKAIRDALAIVAGGYDNGHITVTPILASSSSSSSNGLTPAQLTRRLLQQQQQQQKKQRQQHAPQPLLPPQPTEPAAAPLSVSAVFYGMAPSNASSLMRSLTSRCGSPTVIGKVAAACDEVFRQQFLQAGVLFDPTAFRVAYKEKPQVSCKSWEVGNDAQQ